MVSRMMVGKNPSCYAVIDELSETIKHIYSGIVLMYWYIRDRG